MALTKTDRDALIRRYANGPALLRRVLARVPPAALKWRPGPREWSAHEVVCHCADSETNSYARIRFLVAEPTPVIQGYDQERWAVTFDYHRHPMAPALATVEAVRANTAALIRRLPDSAWAREGTHTESGRYTAEEWLRIYAEHLEIHSRQIDANVAAWRAAHPKPRGGRAASRGRASRRPRARSARRRSA
ncbi:MAG: DinB family protein [Candidatus Rokuibacteriota bacterium]